MGKTHVLLVREWDHRMCSSGCCGRIEGDFREGQGEQVFRSVQSNTTHKKLDAGGVWLFLRVKIHDAPVKHVKLSLEFLG